MPAVADDISAEEVEHIRRLARLALTEDESELFRGQMGRILAYARQLSVVPTTGVPPTSSVGPGATIERPDEVVPSLGPEAALGNAPDRVPGTTLFRAPRVPGE